MRILIARLAVAAVAALLVGGVAAADSASRRNIRRCVPRHATIEARGPLAVAYKNPRNDGLYACLYVSGRARLIVDQFWYPRPAVDVNGRLIGSAAEVSDAAENSITTIVVQELRPKSAPRLRLALVRPPLQVGSLRVKSAGAVAWIECSGESNGPGDPRPDCVAPGRSQDNAVVKRDSATDTTTDRQRVDLLAEGRDIDPRSLQLHGSRLSWTQGGKRHFATLR
jgi:hypothetical protein